MANKTSRSLNFELLRIISTILIVTFHFCSECGADIYKQNFSVNQFGFFVFGSWGVMGVHCFFFISAYFLTNNTTFKSKKLFKLLFQTIFYSSLICCITLLTGIADVNLKIIIKSLLSPFFGQYWYITAYCMLYLVSPLLNKLLHNIQDNELLKLIFILTLLIPIYKTIWPDAPLSDFDLAIYDYLLIAYLKRIPDNWFEHYRKNGFIIMILFIIAMCSVTSLFIGSDKLLIRLTGRYSVFQLITALFLFYIFKNLKLQIVPGINIIAQGSLGVYLIHENPLWRQFITDNLLHLDIIYETSYFIPYMLLCVCLTCFICYCIDLARIKWIEKPFFKYCPLTTKIINNCDASFQRIYN